MRCMKISKKKIIICGIIIAALGIVLFIVLKNISSEDIIDTNYREYEVKNGNITQTLNITGNINAQKVSNIYSSYSAKVIKDYYNEGDVVQKDTILYEMDKSDINAKISAAQLEIEKAQINYDALIYQKENSTIRATESGTIKTIYVSKGDYIVANSIIGTFYNDSKPIITLEVQDFVLDYDSVSTAKISINSDMFTGNIVNKITSSVVEFRDSNVTDNEIIDDDFQLEKQETIIKEIQLAFDSTVPCQNQQQVYVIINGEQYSAQITDISYQEQEILSSVEGVVNVVNYNSGSKINYGDILLKYTDNSISKDIKQAEIELKSAKATLQQYKNELSNYTIKSPITGTILKKYINEGDMFEADNSETPMMVIVDTSEYIVEALVNEKDIDKLELEQVVHITSESNQLIDTDGLIYDIGNTKESIGDNDGYIIKVRPSSIPDSRKLKLGMGVNLIISCSAKENVLVIPSEFVTSDEMVIQKNVSNNGNEPFSEKQISLGISDGANVEVVSGLQQGDIIIHYD